MKRKKIILIIAAILALLAIGLIGYAIVSNQKNTKENANDTSKGDKSTSQTQKQSAGPVSLEGRLGCLEHKYTGDIQTLECTTGLKTDDGKQYALTEQPNDITQATGGDRRVRISGTLTPDPDSIYRIEGTIAITSYNFI